MTFIKKLIGVFLIGFFLLFSLPPTLAQESIILPVPYFYQGAYPDEMTPGVKLKDSGCKVTSVAMGLKYYGLDTDPRKLNSWLKSNGGYTPGGGLVYSAIGKYTEENFKQRYDLKNKWTNETKSKNANDFPVIKENLQKGNPVIVAVRGSTGKAMGHWVVIKGYKDNTFYINDPACQNRTTLNAFNNQIYAVDIIIPPQTSYSKPSLPTLPPPQEQFIAIVIDDSGSMEVNDPFLWREKAAQLFVDKIQEGNTIIVNKFESNFQELAKEKINRENQEKIKKIIKENLFSEGSTDIEGALNQTFDQFSQLPSGKKSVLLLTDGRQTVGDEIVNKESYLKFKRNGWKINVVALLPENYEELLQSGASGGDFPDVPLLQDIAKETGGQFIQTKDPTELMTIYNKILAKIQKTVAALDQGFIIKPQEKKIVAFNVAPKTAQLVFTTIWYGSDIETHLVDPDGKKAKAERIKEENYEILKVDSPKPGKWQAIIKAVEVKEEGEFVNISAETKKDENPPLILLQKPTSYFVKPQFILAFQIKDESPLKKIKVEVGGKQIFNFEGKTTTQKYRLNVQEKLGPFLVKITAEDLAGNKSELTQEFFVDDQPPKIKKFSFIHPKIWKIKENPTIKTEAEEKEGMLSEIKIKIKKDGKKVFEKQIILVPSDKIPTRFVWPIKKEKAGFYKVEVEFKDSFGNTSKKEKRIFLYTLPSIWNWIKGLFFES